MAELKLRKEPCAEPNLIWFESEDKNAEQLRSPDMGS